jgi:hypothetical protein
LFEVLEDVQGGKYERVMVTKDAKKANARMSEDKGNVHCSVYTYLTIFASGDGRFYERGGCS